MVVWAVRDLVDRLWQRLHILAFRRKKLLERLQIRSAVKEVKFSAFDIQSFAFRKSLAVLTSRSTFFAHSSLSFSTSHRTQRTPFLPSLAPPAGAHMPSFSIRSVWPWLTT